MAQQQQKYTVEAFDYRSASKRKLVAMVNGSNNIIGTGILKVESPNKLILTVEGEEYIFNSDGNPVSDNAKTAKYKIMMGVSQVAAIDKGTVGTTNISMTRSVDSSGDVSYETDTTLDKSYEITIDNLNARDQFAIQALHSIMEKLPNADALSKDEITHYCEAAYTWAGYMMEMSSKARSVTKDAKTSDNTRKEEVGYLDNNTEKLLNNIIVALEKTDLKEGNTYSERVINPKLNSILEGLQETVGTKKYERVIIKDLDTFLAKVDLMNKYLNTMNTYLNAINTSIQGFTSTLNSRMNKLDHAISDAEGAILKAMPSTSELATSSEVQTAKDDIIAAMPTCKYTPTTNNTEE